MGELFPVLLTKEQLSLRANKVLEFVCTVIRTSTFTHGLVYLSKVLINLSEIKKETSQWITQKNKIFVFAQIQYKITDQIHGTFCPHASGLWK